MTEQHTEILDLVPTTEEFEELMGLIYIQDEGRKQKIPFANWHPFFKKVSDFLKAKGHDVMDLTEEYFSSQESKDKVTVDYHVYQNKTELDAPKHFLFAPHCDNKNDFKVCTYIYYPICSFPKGGELVLNVKKQFNFDLEKSKSGELVIIDPRKQKVLVLEGDIPHYMSPCIGIGRRDCLIIQAPMRNQK